MIAEILILLAVTVLFTLVFIIALWAFFYALTNFVFDQIEKLRKDRNGLAVSASFGKVLVISFLSLSFFIYFTSFLLRIGDDFFRQEKSNRTAETIILSEREPSLLSEESSEPPLFDLVIQAAAEQNEKKQLTFVLASGGVFALAAIAAMGGYIAYLARNEKSHET